MDAKTYNDGDVMITFRRFTSTKNKQLVSAMIRMYGGIDTSYTITTGTRKFRIPVSAIYRRRLIQAINSEPSLCGRVYARYA